MSAGNFQQVLKQVQAQMQEFENSLEEKELEASSGGGMVTARVTGTGDLKGLAIDPAVIDPDDPEMLEDLIVAAVAAAQKGARKYSREHVRRAAGGLPLHLSNLF